MKSSTHFIEFDSIHSVTYDCTNDLLQHAAFFSFLFLSDVLENFQFDHICCRIHAVFKMGKGQSDAQMSYIEDLEWVNVIGSGGCSPQVAEQVGPVCL